MELWGGSGAEVGKADPGKWEEVPGSLAVHEEPEDQVGNPTLNSSWLARWPTASAEAAGDGHLAPVLLGAKSSLPKRRLT